MGMKLKKRHMTDKPRALGRICKRCNKKYIPIGQYQKFCEPCIFKNRGKSIQMLIIYIIGLTIVLLGATSNFLVVKENDCRMPVYNVYINTDNHFGFINKEKINYFFLADIFTINVIKFSIGDILLIIGVAIMILSIVFFRRVQCYGK